MNYKVKFYFFLLIFLPFFSFAMPIENEDYWICNAHDKANRVWPIKNHYQKVALNLAFNACKKQSKNPTSCKTSTEDCEDFHLGLSTKPFWRCTALDQTAKHWKSNYYHHKDDAILGAKAYCKTKSKVPETCYVHVLTCMNVNERE